MKTLSIMMVRLITSNQKSLLRKKEIKEVRIKMFLKNLPKSKWFMLKIMISIAAVIEKKITILKHSSLKV
jgi:hypothetical protein